MSDNTKTSSEYMERIARAKGHTPVGTVPMPDVPRLDQPPAGPRSTDQRPKGHMTHDQYKEAVQQGKVIPGVGGAYMANQPIKSARKQEEKTTPMKVSSEDGPVNPKRPEGGLREETIEQLGMVAGANRGEPPLDDIKEEEEVKVSEDDSLDPESDDFGFSSLDNIRELLEDPRRRKAIESRCEEITFDDLIFNQEIRQDVKIKKGFVVEFRTPNGDEDLFCKREMANVDGVSRYVIDTYILLGVCCAVRSINGVPLPDHLDKDGVVDKDKFYKKLTTIKKYPMVIILDLHINFTWFTYRVHRLLSYEKVKNF